MSIATDVQQPSPGTLIALFEVDLTPLGGEILRFASGTLPAGDGTFKPVVWRGHTYMPAPFEATGFEVSGKGSLPTPTMRVAASRELGMLLRTYGDCVGMQITRWRTFTKYLDGEPQADPNAHFVPDVFLISRKVAANKVYVEWELSAAMDQQGVKLPRRLILRDGCLWRYRYWDAATGAFDYTDALCPYTGDACFDLAGEPCAPEQDSCGKRLSDCTLRFGDEPLPTGAFPGVSHTRAAS